MLRADGYALLVYIVYSPVYNRGELYGHVEEGTH